MNAADSRIYFLMFVLVAMTTTIALLERIDHVSQPLMVMAASPKYIALTFDDGPYGSPTTQILDILESRHVPATFFVVGKNVEQYPDILRREVAAGYTIGNHSYDHAHLEQYSRDAFRTNLDTAEQIITNTAGIRPLFFRAPYGMTSPDMLAELQSQGFTYVGWSDDPNDWDFVDDPSDHIVQSILHNAHPNGIIILHDGRDVQRDYPRTNTIDALPHIIDHLIARGYTFVTIDQLLHQRAYGGE